MSESETTKSKSPFKDQAILEQEIKDFINNFKAIVVNQATRMSDFFEMSCVNYIVKFYELQNYNVEIKGLQNDKYRYKCSTAGIQSNFSYFEISAKHFDRTYEYEIHHNLAIQSCHDRELFTTPDISIIKKGTIVESNNHYESKRKLSFAKNEDMISFCEVKQFNPYPELIFNFIGIVNELSGYVVFDTTEPLFPNHIAPSLLISGKPNKQTQKIKASLEKRYKINIIFDLFYSSNSTFSKSRIRKLRLAEQAYNWEQDEDEDPEQKHYDTLYVPPDDDGDKPF